MHKTYITTILIRFDGENKKITEIKSHPQIISKLFPNYFGVFFFSDHVHIDNDELY